MNKEQGTRNKEPMNKEPMNNELTHSPYCPFEGAARRAGMSYFKG